MKATLIKTLSNLPSEKTQKFENELVEILEDKAILNIEEGLKEVLSDTSIDQNVRYGAFYGLTIYYRRKKNITYFGDILEEYGDDFEDCLTLLHLKMLYDNEKENTTSIVYNLEKYFELSETFNEHAGILHGFAETIAKLCENKDSKQQKLFEDEWLEKANAAIEKAIKLDRKYAKFYCTRARLRALSGKFEEAKSDLHRAIDLENSSQKDYTIRLGSYQYHLSRIQSLEYLKNMEKEFEEFKIVLKKTEDSLEDQTKNSNIRSLELLGFFAAIVSFTIGSTQLATSMEPKKAFLIIVTLFLSLIAVYSAFGIILHGFKKKTILNFLFFMISIILLVVVYCTF